MSHACLALALLLTLACADSSYGECVFDERYFGPKTYQRNVAVKTLVWVPKTKEAKIITKSNDLISIKHWSCSTLGLEARMFLHPSLEREEALKIKMAELAKIVLSKDDLARLLKDLAAKANLVDGVLHKLPGPENRAEFYYSTNRFADFDVLTIRYYDN
jgi:hypothetical protein